MNREGAVKRLIFVNGTMGVGKSSVSHELKNLLARVHFWTATGVGILRPLQ